MLNSLAASLRQKRESIENDEAGFTLIELLVVVVIIGVLIAIAIPLYLNYTRGANDKGAQSDTRNAVSVLEQCNSDNQTYPTGITKSGNTYTLAGCTGGQINVSSGSTLTYTPNTTTAPVVSYTIVGTNSSGSSKNYCYNSLKGGQVTNVGTATTC